MTKTLDYLTVKRPRAAPRTRHKPPEPDQGVCPGCYEARGWLTDLAAPAVAFAHICPHCRSRWVSEN